MKRLVIGAALACGLGVWAPAQAYDVNVGTLTCHEQGGWGLILGSNRRMRCTFAGSGETERYDGAMTKMGVDIGYKGAGVIVWGVIAPTGEMRPGALAGEYGGATLSATAGVGVGAHALVGGSGNHFTLQPLSLEGSTGLNIAAGVAGLQLIQHR
jgi:hypothetical protein